jgi:spermidine/putrescine transport system permease protein
VFLFVPAVLLVAFSFNKSPFFNLPFTGVTMHWFGVLLRDQAMRVALENSFKVAIPTAVISTVFGLLTALGLRGASRWLRNGVDALVPLPLLVPGLIWSIALLIGFTRLNIQPSMRTLLVGHVLLSLPFVVLLTTTRLNSFRPEWDEAATSLGASRWMFIRRVFIPHMAPALAAGALMAFTISFNDFIVAFFLTGGGFTTLPIYIFSLVRWQSNPSISAVSSLIFLFALLLFLAIAKLQGREVKAAGEAVFAGSVSTSKEQE